jgi:hypothetical protein
MRSGNLENYNLVSYLTSVSIEIVQHNKLAKCMENNSGFLSNFQMKNKVHNRFIMF